MTAKYLIGSVSSGTMNPDDLIPAFLDALRDLDPERAEAIENEFKSEDPGADWDASVENDLLDALFDALNEHAAPYFYFGAHPGDGADYGFWLGDLDCFDGLKVSDTSEVPDDYSGEVLRVNDHGNATLYSAENGKLTEIWAIV
jgi:hypothetical protein